ncbi:glycosyltransferase family 2 protein [Pseudomonas canadensis]|uniref:glycosyltransferase family 2 protein n=1 Tax=Pseudomonas canadensis TaxID=915099 RepID=UPI0030D3B717
MDQDLPLVSVMMPAFNADKTIVYAMASLMSQSYSNWECLVVDDGSTDDTRSILCRLAKFDSRIRIFRFNSNKGRGAARIKTLSEATGKYITMLDADDWIYPDKLAFQVFFMERNPHVTLHSMGLALVDYSKLLSVRKVENNVENSLDSLHKIFVPHAPSMIRLADIGTITYDKRFKLAQDQDFLRRILVGRKYVVSPKIGYSYTELASVSVSKVLRGYVYNAVGYLKIVKFFGVKAFFYCMLEFAKVPYSAFMFIFRGREAVLAGRSDVPDEEQIIIFNNAKKTVDEKYKLLLNIW